MESDGGSFTRPGEPLRPGRPGSTPNHCSIIAAIAFDRTGTTRIGRFIFNHSFMLPGLIATAGGVAIGPANAKLFF